MKTIIFKSDKKAKVYEVRATKDHGCYKKGELIFKVKTDSIDSIMENKYDEAATEVKEN